MIFVLVNMHADCDAADSAVSVIYFVAIIA